MLRMRRGPDTTLRDGDWEALRRLLEAPFRRTAHANLATLHRMLDNLPASREFALTLARFACESPGKFSPFSLAERAELPNCFDLDLNDPLALEDAVEAYRDLACFLLTAKGEWRKKGGLTDATPDSDPGLIALPAASLDDFIQAAARGRVWAREPQVRKVF